MRLKLIAQEHNAVPRPGLEPGRLDPAEPSAPIQPAIRASHAGNKPLPKYR